MLMCRLLFSGPPKFSSISIGWLPASSTICSASNTHQTPAILGLISDSAPRIKPEPQVTNYRPTVGQDPKYWYIWLSSGSAACTLEWDHCYWQYCINQCPPFRLQVRKIASFQFVNHCSIFHVYVQFFFRCQYRMSFFGLHRTIKIGWSSPDLKCPWYQDL
jgi:hypothetical protein